MTARDYLAVIGAAFVLASAIPGLLLIGLLVGDAVTARRHRPEPSPAPIVSPSGSILVYGEGGRGYEGVDKAMPRQLLCYGLVLPYPELYGPDMAIQALAAVLDRDVAELAVEVVLCWPVKAGSAAEWPKRLRRGLEP